jgi:hypothetical protein
LLWQRFPTAQLVFAAFRYGRACYDDVRYGHGCYDDSDVSYSHVFMALSSFPRRIFAETETINSFTVLLRLL